MFERLGSMDSGRLTRHPTLNRTENHGAVPFRMVHTFSLSHWAKFKVSLGCTI